MSTGRKVLFCLFAILFVGALTYGGLYIHSQREREKVYQDMETEKDSVETEEEKVQMTETDDIAQEETVKPDIPVDFEKLQKENPDIYAWITIPDTKIDYPVLQSESDDTYYLNHTVEKKKGLPGSIYSESQNRKDFSDPNTVLYGHNMKNGSMFGHLKKFAEDQNVYNKSKYFWILTPDKNYRYEIISAYTTGVDSDTYTLFKGPGEEFQRYLETIKGYSEISTDPGELTIKDKIVTLSTCTGNEATRFVVQGRRISSEDAY